MLFTVYLAILASKLTCSTDVLVNFSPFTSEKGSQMFCEGYKHVTNNAA